ncbi:MAG: GNAT family N-acetyltransferase [Dyadobacter sp.]|uniref:GNAT family N-acetyltransferase n=1 Tax=Dyadobacter sp. TaxID=1914288 RepID=UPI00326569DC
MKHILDNPVWNALRTNNSSLGQVGDGVANFLPEVSPFAALDVPATLGLQVLHDTFPFSSHVIFVSNQKVEEFLPWKLVAAIGGYQMLYNGPANPESVGPEVVSLTAGHVPEMVALTSLTNPGPFARETIRFGHYEGIFDHGRLVAMAGQRLHPEGFAEISAVCTHPDHLGKGYARHLLLRQVNRIQQTNEKPFLHVKADNVRAIGVYESLGFVIRTEIFFYVLVKGTN